MYCSKLLKLMAGLTLIVSFLVGCSLKAAPKPDVGHWEGEPAVSFDVNAEGNIRDFRLVAPFGGGSGCEITGEEVSVEDDGAFVFVNAIGAFENRVSGKFDDSGSASGTFSIRFCANGKTVTITTVASEETWNASVQRP